MSEDDWGISGHHSSSLAKPTQLPPAVTPLLVQPGQLSPFLRENSSSHFCHLFHLNSSIRSYQKHKPQCFNYCVVRSLGCRFLFLVYLAVAAFPDGKMTLQSTAHICLHEFLLLCLWLNIHYELISIFYWYVSHRLFLALAAYQHVDSPTGRPFNLSAVFRANI